MKSGSIEEILYLAVRLTSSKEFYWNFLISFMYLHCVY